MTGRSASLRPRFRSACVVRAVCAGRGEAALNDDRCSYRRASQEPVSRCLGAAFRLACDLIWIDFKKSLVYFVAANLFLYCKKYGFVTPFCALLHCFFATPCESCANANRNKWMRVKPSK